MNKFYDNLWKIHRTYTVYIINSSKLFETYTAMDTLLVVALLFSICIYHFKTETLKGYYSYFIPKLSKARLGISLKALNVYQVLEDNIYISIKSFKDADTNYGNYHLLVQKTIFKTVQENCKMLPYEDSSILLMKMLCSYNLELEELYLKYIKLYDKI